MSTVIAWLGTLLSILFIIALMLSLLVGSGVWLTVKGVFNKKIRKECGYHNIPEKEYVDKTVAASWAFVALVLITVLLGYASWKIEKNSILYGPYCLASNTFNNTFNKVSDLGHGAWRVAYYDHTYEGKLKLRVEEISSLRQKLASKKRGVEALAFEFSNDIERLKNEIDHEKQTQDIQSFEVALDNQLIKYNITLLQQKLAYLAKLKEALVVLTKGGLELAFLEEKAYSDFKIGTVLGKDAVKSLVKEIDRIIAKYLPYADEFVIDVAGVEVKSRHQIWQEIADNRQQK